MNRFGPESISVERELADVAEQLRRSTVVVGAEGQGRGSGVIWRSDGLIVTNAHVATSLRHTVKLADGRVFTADLVRRDPRVDLAILKIAASGLASVQSRDASSLRTGELVLAVGNPIEAAGAFSVGVVSASPKPGDALVRADIRLAPGNSGGPLADAQGQIVGINSMVVAGFGIAVTTSMVKRLLARERRRTIGVTVQMIDVIVEGLPVPGLMVVDVEAGGAAHLSGVLIGDVIVRVNGEALNSPEQLAQAIHHSSDVLSIKVLRAGRLESCQVRPTTANAESVAEVA